MTLRDEIEDFLRKFGAFKVRVSYPEQGFETAKSGCHPKNLMKNCNSVIVFAFHVGLDYYTTLDYHQKGDVEKRVLHIYRDWVSIKLVHFLEDMSYEAVFPHGLMRARKR